MTTQRESKKVTPLERDFETNFGSDLDITLDNELDSKEFSTFMDSLRIGLSLDYNYSIDSESLKEWQQETFK